jgi:hypothetical protein
MSQKLNMKYTCAIMMAILLPCLGSYSQTTFHKSAIDPAKSNITGIYAGDLNNDGLMDIAVCENPNNSIVIWLNNEGDSLSFTKYIVDDSFAHPLYLVIKDIDKDGNHDILASSSQDNSVAWWRNEGGNPIQWTRQIIDAGLPNAHAVDVADFNEDGFNDILATSSGSNQLTWYESDGANPVNWTKRAVDTTFPNSQSAMAVDLDNDSHMDVVASSSSGNEISWWRNKGGQPLLWEKFIIANSLSGVDFPHWIQAVDMDNDGDLDVLGSMYMTGEIAWWRNDMATTSNWSKNVVVGNFLGVLNVQVADMDNDSLMDVIGTSTYLRDVTWWKNISNSASWTENTIDGNFKGAWPLFVCDLDNDGDNDIIAGADVPTNNSPLTIWKNMLPVTSIHESLESEKGNRLAIYPDPFCSNANIDFTTEKPGLVKLGVYNLQGILIKELINHVVLSGTHTLVFDGKLLGSGVFVFRLEAGGNIIYQKAVLAR